MSINIPPGLTNLLEDFTLALLLDNPPDIVSFAIDYFKQLKENPGSKKIGRLSTNTSSDIVVSEKYDPEAESDMHHKVVHPKSDAQRQRLVQACKPVILFTGLDDEQLKELIDAMMEKKVKTGDHIITEGEDGDNFYVIEKGHFDIIVGGKKFGSYIDSGSFGELALLYNQPRAATIISTTPGTLWAIERTVFKRIVLLSAYKKRKAYESLIESVPMFKTLDLYERMNVADAFVSVTYKKDQCVIKQGDEATSMFFVEQGQARIMVKQPNATHEVELKKISTGEFFGELALVTHKLRAASVYADGGPLKVAVLDVGAFERLMGPCMDIMKRNISTYDKEMLDLAKRHQI